MIVVENYDVEALGYCGMTIVMCIHHDYHLKADTIQK